MDKKICILSVCEGVNDILRYILAWRHDGSLFTGFYFARDVAMMTLDICGRDHSVLQIGFSRKYWESLGENGKWGVVGQLHNCYSVLSLLR
jgi:hypothetical protein